MSQQRLDTLLRAIHNAVIRAQEITEEQHILQLDKYFDEEGKPIVQELELPSMNPDAAPGTSAIVKVPLLSLIPPTAIKIKELKVDFNTSLGLFQDEAAEGVIAADMAMRNTGNPDDGRAHVEITFVGTDPAESFLRINDHLIKSIL